MNESVASRGRARLAVCLSGSGRTLQNLCNCSIDGRLNATIQVVISSVDGVRGVDIARQAAIPVAIVSRRKFERDEDFSRAIYDAIEPFRVDLMVLAGFLQKLEVTPDWEGRIVNIHPALLPEMAFASGRGYFGKRVHEVVLASGAKTSGATVHVVDNEYDAGPAIARTIVPVLDADTPETLAARVFEAECELYPRAINAYLEERSNVRSSRKL